MRLALDEHSRAQGEDLSAFPNPASKGDGDGNNITSTSSIFNDNIHVVKWEYSRRDRPDVRTQPGRSSNGNGNSNLTSDEKGEGEGGGRSLNMDIGG
jgi:hypothetical protein